MKRLDENNHGNSVPLTQPCRLVANGADGGKA